MYVYESPFKDRRTNVCVYVCGGGGCSFGCLLPLCLCLVFPTETHQGFLHEQVMEAWLHGGVGRQGRGVCSRTLRWLLCSAVVSATFPVSLRRHECAFLHICCLRGQLVGRFVLESRSVRYLNYSLLFAILGGLCAKGIVALNRCQSGVFCTW